MKVLEIFKGAELIGTAGALTVAQNTVEHRASPSSVAHAGGGTLFKASEEYVLFLERLPGETALGVAWGAGGAYKLGAETVKVPGLAQKMWQFRDEVSREELLNALRAKRDN